MNGVFSTLFIYKKGPKPFATISVSLSLCHLINHKILVISEILSELLIISEVKRLKVKEKNLRTDMAFQQYFVQEWESVSKPSTESERPSACFDCSICLDFARDPVVTLCGHLYCWPCIYKWFDSQNASLPSDERPQCPVCKAEISEKTMVPLYGRGQSLSESGPEGKIIPPRPPACGIKGLTELFSPEQQYTASDSYQNPHNFGNHYTSYGGEDSSPQLFNVGGTEEVSLSHPTVGMLGEMVYARVFGNSQSLYTYPNSYQSVVSRTPRLRRQEMQADRSLNRVTIFLFCFFLLCLLVF